MNLQKTTTGTGTGGPFTTGASSVIRHNGGLSHDMSFWNCGSSNGKMVSYIRKFVV
jgi:hypothetical protein